MYIQGTIYDAKTRQPLPAATVAVMKDGQYTGEGVVADGAGHYLLNVSDPSADVAVSSLGYITTVASMRGGDFYLDPYTTELPGVTVTAPAPTTWRKMQPLVIGVMAFIAISLYTGSKQK